jgi:DNA-directed RNA polymerase beta' subunit
MEQKRNLTSEELSEILSYVTLRRGVPEDVAKAQQENTQGVLLEQLEKVEIYPSKIPEFKKVIEMKYTTTQIPAGTMVGALAATSIGEPMTQLVLNSFHSSGIAKSNVTTGIPRMEELINVTSNNKMCGMRLFLKDNDHTDIVKLRSICKEHIEHYSLQDIIIEKYITSVDKIKDLSVFKNIEERDFQDWHDYHSLMISEDYKQCQHALVFHINKSKLFSIKKSLVDIADIIDSCGQDSYSVSSDEDTSVIISYIDVSDLSSIESIEKKKNKNDDEDLTKYSFINEDNKHYYYIRDIVLPELLIQTVSGVEGVSECIYDQPLGIGQINGKKMWVVNTRGSNFREILNHPLVDHTKTTTSKLKEIESVLGVEAARSFLLNEFASIISSSKRHIEQLVNCMTFSGRIRAANRHGIDKAVGVLAQMSFEQPIKNAIDASITNQTDNLAGVSSQLMLGKYARIGTGYMDVLIDTKKLMSYSFPEVNSQDTKIIPNVTSHTESHTNSPTNNKISNKLVIQSIKSKRTNVGEVVSRKVFTKSQLTQPSQSKPIFKTNTIIEKEKHETFDDEIPIRKKVTQKIEQDIQTKFKRSKQGFAQITSTVGDTIEF